MIVPVHHQPIAALRPVVNTRLQTTRFMIIPVYHRYVTALKPLSAVICRPLASQLFLFSTTRFATLAPKSALN